MVHGMATAVGVPLQILLGQGRVIDMPGRSVTDGTCTCRGTVCGTASHRKLFLMILSRCDKG